MKSYTFLFGLMLLMISVDAYPVLRIVTTTQDLAAFAEAVGGERVEVQSLTQGTRDPHFAAAKPSMIRRVFRADLLLVIGADMEIGWLPPLLQSARNARVRPGNPGYLDLSNSIALLGKSSGPVTRAMGDVHAKGNPHYWLDPANGIRMARAIAARLGELDPAPKDGYQQRINTFAQTLEEKLQTRKDILHTHTHQPNCARPRRRCRAGLRKYPPLSRIAPAQRLIWSPARPRCAS